MKRHGKTMRAQSVSRLQTTDINDVSTPIQKQHTPVVNTYRESCKRDKTSRAAHWQRKFAYFEYLRPYCAHCLFHFLLSVFALALPAFRLLEVSTPLHSTLPKPLSLRQAHLDALEWSVCDRHTEIMMVMKPSRSRSLSQSKNGTRRESPAGGGVLSREMKQLARLVSPKSVNARCVPRSGSRSLALASELGVSHQRV